jgi:hypothetical protein
MQTIICDKKLFFKGEEYNAEIQIRSYDRDSFIWLSITGTCFTGPKLLKSKRNLICFGQCHEEAKAVIPGRLHKIWRRWHLNDMKAGTPKQEGILRVVKFYREQNNLPQLDYKEACELLKMYGLYDDNGYRYGTRWLREELPKSVIDYILSL